MAYSMDKDKDPLHARTEQLEFRLQEIYTAYEAFCSFVRKEPSVELSTIDDSVVPVESWSVVDPSSGKGPIRLSEDVTLAGHSFGGCTIVRQKP
jgi:platelet-activating factor acetylhydrolase